jgi:hypothetical protein
MFTQGAWLRLSRLGRVSPLGALAVRVAGAMLAASSLFALWHGVGAALCAVTA